jgi:hypothetical protein
MNELQSYYTLFIASFMPALNCLLCIKHSPYAKGADDPTDLSASERIKNARHILFNMTALFDSL